MQNVLFIILTLLTTTYLKCTLKQQCQKILVWRLFCGFGFSLFSYFWTCCAYRAICVAPNVRRCTTLQAILPNHICFKVKEAAVTLTKGWSCKSGTNRKKSHCSMWFSNISLPSCKPNSVNKCCFAFWKNVHTCMYACYFSEERSTAGQWMWYMKCYLLHSPQKIMTSPVKTLWLLE